MRPLPSAHNATITFLAANQSASSRLALDEEIRDIDARLRRSRYRDQIVLRSRWAVQPGDLLEALNDDQPSVVHFSGHGNSGMIFLHDGTPISPSVSQRLFAVSSEHIRVVTLSACYSREHGVAISQVVDTVVCMADRIDDESARLFASAFYGALGYGLSVKRAFEQGRVSLALHASVYAEVPRLIVRGGVNPDEVFLVDDERLEALSA